jgi:hypothetical protein
MTSQTSQTSQFEYIWKLEEAAELARLVATCGDTRAARGDAQLRYERIREELYGLVCALPTEVLGQYGEFRKAQRG